MKSLNEVLINEELIGSFSTFIRELNRLKLKSDSVAENCGAAFTYERMIQYKEFFSILLSEGIAQKLNDSYVLTPKVDKLNALLYARSGLL